jgi:hypothetical protein
MKLAPERMENRQMAAGVHTFASALTVADEQLLRRHQREAECLSTERETDVAALTR